MSISSIALDLFRNEDVVVAQGSNLWHMGDGYDLARKGDLSDLLCDRLSGFAADACIDFVKDDGRDSVGFDESGFEGEHDSCRFAAGNDFS